MARVLDYLPRGQLVDDASWLRRHHFLVAVLASLAPILLVFGLLVGNTVTVSVVVALVPLLTAAGGWFIPGRLPGELFVSAGLSMSSAGLVILSGGYIEAHFSFFVIIGFLMLYQSWVPFAVNIVFTTLSHGIGTLLLPTLFFNHHAAQHDPWLWSGIHGFAVLLACLGVAIFVKITEDEQRRRIALTQELHDAKVRQQEFTSELLLNLARRNQSMFHRQLDIINDLEERERDPDALSDLFRLDHLATRVRRNAESLLVLSGEQPARTWSEPVALRDVVRAGVAETEDLDRVTLVVDERPRVVGSSVADLTHMVAELVENAARYSPPAAPVVIQTRPYHREPGAHLLIIEDTGIGMPPPELAAANELLADPQEVDVSAAARRLGFHVVSRLAERHGIRVTLSPTPGCGVTAVLLLPPAIFAESASTVPAVGGRGIERVPASAVPAPRRGPAEQAGTNGNGNGASAPVSGPIVLNGRHSWPGSTPAEADGVDGVEHQTDGQAGARRPAHAAPGEEPEPVEAVAAGPGQGTEGAGEAEAAGADVPDGHDTVEDLFAPGSGSPAPRRGLIHPIVVPPPGSDEPSPGAPEPRRSTEDAPAVVGPNGLVLARRRPQTHLAPELIRQYPNVPAATAPTPLRAPVTDTPGRHDPTPPATPPGDQGAMSALSAYQASRAAARTVIDAAASDDGHHTGRHT
ncbi:hypothetical protein GCM10023200_18770 [Actinomycetospora chlora]|uniref:histidine kinase n=1 Tax=Actinomycetospora chlora TaxID=663608 RepID=A0ABP9ASN6_9PSEU